MNLLCLLQYPSLYVFIFLFSSSPQMQFRRATMLKIFFSYLLMPANDKSFFSPTYMESLLSFLLLHSLSIIVSRNSNTHEVGIF